MDQSLLILILNVRAFGQRTRRWEASTILNEDWKFQTQGVVVRKSLDACQHREKTWRINLKHLLSYQRQVQMFSQWRRKHEEVQGMLCHQRSQWFDDLLSIIPTIRLSDIESCVYRQCLIGGRPLKHITHRHGVERPMEWRVLMYENPMCRKSRNQKQDVGNMASKLSHQK